MKYLIVGLGNPGLKYENTRHNIGFITLDALVKASNVSFETAKLGNLSKLKHKGRTLIFLKPNTFMNLSGKAMQYWMTKEKIPMENVLVITDDLALPFGTVRMRTKGSDGGHNGLKDIQLVLGTNKYPRIRFGVGSEFKKGKQIDYVLGEWDEHEAALLPERLEHLGKMILGFATIGAAHTMSEYNNK
ncbi:MAG: aminoacyl-tRNA hydrolase [Flavobacteriales bacterium]